MEATVEAGKFIGTRLTEAREAMGLNITNLADLIGVSRPMIYDYEGGLAQPSEETFERICTLLKQPPRFFYHPGGESEYAHELVHFRALMSVKGDFRAKAGIRLKWLIEYFSLLEGELSLPKPNFPDLKPSNDPTLISGQFIEDAAIEIRRFWGLGDGPLPNLIRLLERNGAVIGQVTLDLPKLDGLSFWSHTQDRPFILLNTDKASSVRSRFDLAHELGHMILHRNVAKEAAKEKSTYKLMESQVDKFASAFLLPRDSWLKDMKARKATLAVFKSLKPKWRTSIIAMIMRSEHLDIIPPERKTKLLSQLSSKKWRPKEPYDDLWELERPKLFEQATKMLAEHGFGAGVIAQMFPRRVENISEITGLPPTFFETDILPIRMLN